MGKTQKTIALIAVIILSAFLLKNLFTKPDDVTVDPKIYEYKLKPINFAKKKFPAPDQSRNDPAIQYAKLWNLPELHEKNSEKCLDNFVDQHPNNLVQKQKSTSLYGIEIGSENWYALTHSYERYASEVCYSFSGQEIEIVYADSVNEILSNDEVLESLGFYKTELGKKIIYANNVANEKLIEAMSNKQRNTINKEVEIYYEKLESLQE